MTLVDQLDWRGDHFLLAGFTFRLQHQAQEHTADDAFLFFKDRSQVEQFDRFLDETKLRPKNVLELGIWDGGSAAFWTETLKLKKYSAIDISDRGDSTYYKSWSESRSKGRTKTHWGVDQTDRAALGSVVTKDSLDPIDLVLDDCSHFYEQTLASFEYLFPLVRVGGYYVVEDWAWALRPEFLSADHAWATFSPLHPIVHQLVDLHGSRPDIIPSIRVFPDFVAVERGPASLGAAFNVSVLTNRRQQAPLPTRVRRAVGAARRSLIRR